MLLAIDSNKQVRVVAVSESSQISRVARVDLGDPLSINLFTNLVSFTWVPMGRFTSTGSGVLVQIGMSSIKGFIHSVRYPMDSTDKRYEVPTVSPATKGYNKALQSFKL
ncbi:Hypothetical predicted protein [Olea europaea subsp. europaea]|uniref:Uncharacterized protein n=1 Tax=Olea europaea subsp. europaea TaxID=158383 RepID=A0A8S0PVW7_OLEEU|nr:Hypothetical predicted protein [Olea europaea subsp. europaea]